MEKISFSGEKRKVSKTEAKLYKFNDGGNTPNPLETSVDSQKTDGDLFEKAKEIFGATEPPRQEGLPIV